MVIYEGEILKNKTICVHNGLVHDVLIRDNMFGLSISALDRYLGSPVVFLKSFAMRARTMDERVSLNTRTTARTNAPENLRKSIRRDT